MRNQIQKKVAIIAAIAILSINANAQWTTTGAVIAPTDLTKNVSIGATTNGANFYVEKANAVTLGIKSQTAGATMFMDKGISTANAAFAYKLNGTTLWNTGMLGGNNYSVRNVVNNTFPLVVTQADMVGLGTVTPSAALHMQKAGLADVLIKSSGNGAQLTIDRAANGYEAVTRYAQTGTTLWKTGLNVNAGGTAEYVIRNENIFADALTVTASNNAVSLHSGLLYLGNSELVTNGNDFRINAAIPGIGFGTPGNINLALPALWGASGNVSIGTTDASKAKLVVQGNVGNTIGLFRRSSSSAGVSIVGDWPGIFLNSYYDGGTRLMTGGYAGVVNFNPSLGYITFNVSNATGAAGDIVNAAEAMYIFNNGNVGIGTNANLYKLDVCGTMRAKEVRVATGWCDYVFADDYKLPALSDVEAFIKTNKHLPDVTPGSVIEGEGLEVGKTSAQMIKKIEELTLYVIELQKQVNELKCAK